MAVHEEEGKSDEWYTPKYIFDALECKFDLDVASPVDRTYCNVPADYFITEDSLNKEYFGFCWMNPPFSGRNSKGIWLNKLYEHGSGICLTPDRTSAPWWQEASQKADIIMFVFDKIKFIGPDGKAGNSPSTGTTLWGYGEQAVQALLNGEKHKLGLCFEKYRF